MLAGASASLSVCDRELCLRRASRHEALLSTELDRSLWQKLSPKVQKIRSLLSRHSNCGGWKAYIYMSNAA